MAARSSGTSDFAVPTGYLHRWSSNRAELPIHRGPRTAHRRAGRSQLWRDRAGQSATRLASINRSIDEEPSAWTTVRYLRHTVGSRRVPQLHRSDRKAPAWKLKGYPKREVASWTLENQRLKPGFIDLTAISHRSRCSLVQANRIGLGPDNEPHYSSRRRWPSSEPHLAPWRLT